MSDEQGSNLMEIVALEEAFKQVQEAFQVFVRVRHQRSKYDLIKIEDRLMQIMEKVRHLDGHLAAEHYYRDPWLTYSTKYQKDDEALFSWRNSGRRLIKEIE